MTRDHDIETLLSEMTAADTDLIAPPADLWARIDAAVRSDVLDDDDRVGFGGVSPSPTPASAAPPSSPSSTNVVSLASRRRLPRPVFLGAAAAAVLVVVGLVLVASPDDPAPTVVATADLTFDPANFDALGADATAEVALVDDGGTLRIDVENSTLPVPTGENADLELWLIEPDAAGNPAELVSLGVVDPQRPGDFAVPSTVDPSVFSIVDISIEPRDGDASHSGRSILRGTLDA